MIKKLKIKNSFLISLDKKEDFRGYFARLFCKDTLKKIGISNTIKQLNLSKTKKKGTIRGLHYQIGKFAETKRIIVLKGKIFDVSIDLRKKSKTYLKKNLVYLSEKKLQMLVIPKGVAHGYQSITNDTVVMYLNDNNYSKTNEFGVRYNEKKIKINWPIKKIFLSSKDKNYPDLD